MNGPNRAAICGPDVRMYVGVLKTAGKCPVYVCFCPSRRGVPLLNRVGRLAGEILKKGYPLLKAGKVKLLYPHFGRFWYTNVHSCIRGISEGGKYRNINYLEVYVCILVYIYKRSTRFFYLAYGGGSGSRRGSVYQKTFWYTNVHQRTPGGISKWN
jgi:hypothetical protein